MNFVRVFCAFRGKKSDKVNREKHYNHNKRNNLFYFNKNSFRVFRG